MTDLRVALPWNVTIIAIVGKQIAERADKMRVTRSYLGAHPVQIRGGRTLGLRRRGEVLDYGRTLR